MIEFPAGVRSFQTTKTPGVVFEGIDGEIYRMTNGRALRLVPIDTDDHPDPAAPGVAPCTATGD